MYYELLKYVWPECQNIFKKKQCSRFWCHIFSAGIWAIEDLQIPDKSGSKPFATKLQKDEKNLPLWADKDV